MPIVKDEVRKLATVERVQNIRPIEGADSIVQANVRGWTVVVKKGEFQEGDLVVYFEVDTALPLNDERFAFLGARGVKIVDGEEFHVLKTARLRGVYSQGLVQPWEDWKDEIIAGEVARGTATRYDEGTFEPLVGLNVTDSLNLGKWETPLPVGNGETAGVFLEEYARKTDSERVQNLTDVWPALKSIEWDVTEKVDGTSCTVVRDVDGNLRVMGRNWEIREGDNTYWNVVKRYSQLFDLLEPGDVIQMEIAGVGIQKNRLKLQGVWPFVFDFARGKVIQPRSEWPDALMKWAVPLVEFSLPETPMELIEMVDGMKSLINPSVLAEGVVFHTRDGSVVPEVGDRNTFKVISNKFLSKTGE